MKKFFILIWLFFSFHLANSQHLDVKTCYQEFRLIGGGPFNILSGSQGITINFENVGFDQIKIWDGSTQTIIDGNIGNITVPANTDLNITGWINENLALNYDLSVYDVNNVQIITPGGCLGFGQDISLSLNSLTGGFTGFCNATWSATDISGSAPLSTPTITQGPPAKININDNDFCPDPPISICCNVVLCKTIEVKFVIGPCSGQSCPPIEIKKNINVCCNDCLPYSPIHSKKDLTTSVDDFEIPGNLILYPNPANNSVTIGSEKGNIVNIYDISGKLFYSSCAIEENTIINTSNWPVGVYYVKIQNSEKNNSFQKLIISR